jgi:D-beta-D-heptose 7-phosphate kinase / D-beta-D-heptose 1-phosphate adenosyltransferase
VIAPRRLTEIAALTRGRRVTVIGDLMLDEFLVGSVERISPEAPIPVLTYDSHRHMLGGAGNAARTLAALGAASGLVALVGEDFAGSSVIDEAVARGISVAGVVATPRRSTTQKTRVIAGTQQIVRIDREATGNAGAAALEALRRAALAAVAVSDAVVISDYDKGAVSATLARDIIAACRDRGIPCVVDTKAAHAAFRGATVLTPNMGELARMGRVQHVTAKGLDRAASFVMKRLAPGALLVTRSEDGMSLFLADGSRTDIPALATEVHDVTGAGDTVAAVVALGLASGLALTESADLANLAAAVVVRKVGTDAPSWDEMAARAKE